MHQAGEADSSGNDWQTSPLYESGSVQVTPSRFYEVTDLLLERPNLNSSYLFRADVLSDSSRRLKTVSEKEVALHFNPESRDGRDIASPLSPDRATNRAQGPVESSGAHLLTSLAMTLRRTVIRRLIPRKPQVDPPLTQSCFVLTDENPRDEQTIMVVYVPHVSSEEEMPWYHPRVRALAYRYRPDGPGDRAVISIHYVPFPTSSGPLPDRLHRTLLSLMQMFLRLSKMDVRPVTSSQTASSDGKYIPLHARDMNRSTLKDTILPQHVVQDTYTRLKQMYAADLMARWVEKTEPSKHVFEDLAIAAFLIELWTGMYRERSFPGFVDIACGNGILVYVLIKEGFRGHGFDARRRKSWDILGIDDRLEEKLCIPKLFLEVLSPEAVTEVSRHVRIHDGIFPLETFIISNHADELTVWTPILAALSDVENPLPFLVIPCCSHALSGAKYRYTPKDVAPASETTVGDDSTQQPRKTEDTSSGDLKALRLQRQKEHAHVDDKSTYVCLTRKTVAVAEELDFETEATMMRIPSTRNIGIVGNRHLKLTRRVGETARAKVVEVEEEVTDKIYALVKREAARSGGLEAAAEIWLAGARKLLQGKGRGKVNLGGPRDVVGRDGKSHGDKERRLIEEGV